jgi:hypothetical protein
MQRAPRQIGEILPKSALIGTDTETARNFSMVRSLRRVNFNLSFSKDVPKGTSPQWQPKETQRIAGSGVYQEIS